MGHQGGHRARVEPDLGVGQVVVVQQDQIRLRAAQQLGHLGQLALDVDLHPVGAGQRAVRLGVEPDRQAVPAQRRPGRRRGLPDREPGEDPVRIDLEVSAQGVHPAGLQPLLGEVAQVAPGGLGEGGQQVGEPGVAPGVLGEIGADAGQELLLPDEGDQLAQRRGALGVGDAVEVEFDGLQVDHVGGDRVGARQLVLPVGPGFARVGEGGPRIVPRGAAVADLALREVGGPFGEGLVEPQVVPPGHGDQVAEPHVGELVQDRVVPAFVGGVGRPGAEQVLVADRHAAGVLHGPGVELGDEDLGVVGERVGEAEVLLEDLETGFGDGEQPVGVQVLDQRLAAGERQRDLGCHTGVAVGDGVELAGHQRGDVGGDRRGRRKAEPAQAVALRRGGDGGGVGEHRPGFGGDHGELEGGLQVGLLEAGVHPAGVGGLELGVQVDPAVHWVDEAVQPLAGVAVPADRHRLEFVLAGGGGEVQLVIGEGGGVQRLAVQGGAEQPVGDQVEVGVGRVLAAEGDFRARDEGLLGAGVLGIGDPPGEVDEHLVALHGEPAGALLGLGAGDVCGIHGDLGG